MTIKQQQSGEKIKTCTLFNFAQFEFLSQGRNVEDFVISCHSRSVVLEQQCVCSYHRLSDFGLHWDKKRCEALLQRFTLPVLVVSRLHVEALIECNKP